MISVEGSQRIERYDDPNDMGTECSVHDYSGPQPKRLNLEADCYRFTDCLFEDLSGSANGGAILLGDTDDFSTSASITRTTFHRCCATGSGGQRGGAIFSESQELEILQSCVVGCRADLLGGFVDIWETDCQNRFTGVSCVACGQPGIGDGTVNCGSNLRLSLDTMNFTNCAAVAEGSALKAGMTNVQFTMVYITCVGNGVGTVIHSSQSSGTASSVSMSNFYDNSASGGVLCCSGGIGLSVSDCIFRSSGDPATAPAPAIVIVGSFSRPFSISKCVFSGAPPSSEWASLDSANVFDSLTLSHAISFSHSLLCPTASPTATFSSNFDLTEPFAASPIFHSIPLPPSLDFAPTGSFSGTYGRNRTIPSPRVRLHPR
jgi:hypothetical protein